MGFFRHIEQYNFSTNKMGRDEFVPLGAFENLTVEKTVPFHFPPKRLRFSLRSLGIVWKSKWYCSIYLSFFFFIQMERAPGNRFLSRAKPRGSRDGIVVSALSFHQCGSRSIPARGHMWVEFVIGSSLAPRVFLRVLRFSPSTKTNNSKFQFDQYRILTTRMKTS